VKQDLRLLRWIGSAKKDLLAMPDEVQQTFGFALYYAQIGMLHPAAKAWECISRGVHSAIRRRGLCPALLCEEIEARYPDT
jgi:phage-related protein